MRGPYLFGPDSPLPMPISSLPCAGAHGPCAAAGSDIGLFRSCEAAVGQVALAMIGVPRYRHSSIAGLQQLVLEPLIRDRIAIASTKGKDEADLTGGSLAGIATWASVSDEVDGKIREQIKAGVFPVRLKPDDWASGDKVWLFDVIAPSRQVASSVLANFKQVVKEGDVRIHPMVARMVDPELLKKMGAVADGGSGALKNVPAEGTA
jgi:cytolysin-activating lysine-acyltransferase